MAQTYNHFEFIIVDDGSTDRSATIMREFAARDGRIQLFFGEHGGRGRAANAAIAKARGELIARMDADDIALPERLAVQLAWMRQAGVDICGSCVKRFGSQDRLLWFPETHDAIRHELLFRIGLLQPTVLMRADIAKSHPYDEQSSHEDYEMWTRLAPLYRMGNVPQVLLKHRCHAQQSNVVELAAFREDLRKFGKRYFHTLFPDAPEEDYTAIARVTEKGPFPNLAGLERAGEWLVRLAQTPDNYLRQQMADRWWAACQKSGHLGLGCYRVYRQIAAQFGIALGEGTFTLWATCALRLQSNSRLYAVLASTKRTMKLTQGPSFLDRLYWTGFTRLTARQSRNQTISEEARKPGRIPYCSPGFMDSL